MRQYQASGNRPTYLREYSVPCTHRPENSATMKRFAFVPLALFTTPALAQNLVLNGSFEEYSTCPDGPSQIAHAQGWQPYQGSPEYYNACSDDPWASVPANKVGYQIPYAGDAYAGIITYSDSDWFMPPEFLRESIGMVLSEPLSVGTPVYISFRMAIAAFGMPGTHVKWTSNGVGAKLRMAPSGPQSPAPATNDPVIQLTELPLDTSQ